MLYLGLSLKVCFLEAVLRDERDGVVGDYLMDETELDTRRYAEVQVREALKLIDLRGDGPVRMGVPSDVPRGSRQTLARKWSVAFHDHPEQVGGIIYPSRLNLAARPAVARRGDRDPGRHERTSGTWRRAIRLHPQATCQRIRQRTGLWLALPPSS